MSAPPYSWKKFNERHGLNTSPSHPPSPLPNERPFWKVENYMSAPALIKIITVIVISGEDLITWDGLFQSYYHKTKD